MKNLCFILLATASLSAIDSFSTYERAQVYYDHSWQQTSVALDALSRIPFRGDEKILEIGCRGGRISSNLAGRVPHGSVKGAEMRGEGAIAFATKNHAKELYSNLEFLAEDFRNSEEKETYDLIVSFSSLHWFQDHMQILQKAHQALKDGGKIFFTIPCKPLPAVEETTTLLRENDKWKEYFTNYVHPRRKFTAEEYQTFLTETGFKSIQVTMERQSYFFANKRDLIDWFAAFTPMLDNVPEERREEFLTDFANSYVEVTPLTPQGQVPFFQDELYVQAEK